MSDPDRALGAILQLCSRLLEKEDLAPAKNFFELGGSSLDALELVSALHKEHQLATTLEDVFSAPSLGHLAAQCASLAPPPDS